MLSRPEPAMDELGAGVVSRVVAFGVDGFLVGTAWAVLWFGASGVRGGMDGGLSLLAGEVSAVGAALWFLTWLAVTGLAFAYFAASHAVAGQTPGKRMVDVVVARADGEPCGPRAAAVRTAVLLAPAPVVALADLLFEFPGAAVGALVVGAWLLVELGALALDDDARRLGDRLAGTVVVPERLATL